MVFFSYSSWMCQLIPWIMKLVFVTINHLSTWPQLFHSCEIYSKRKVIYTYLITLYFFLDCSSYSERKRRFRASHATVRVWRKLYWGAFQQGRELFRSSQYAVFEMQVFINCGRLGCRGNGKNTHTFQSNWTFISICVDFMVKFSPNKDQNTAWEMRPPTGEKFEKSLAVITFWAIFQEWLTPIITVSKPALKTTPS